MTFVLGVATGAVGCLVLCVLTAVAFALYARAADRRERDREPPVEQWAKDLRREDS